MISLFQDSLASIRSRSDFKRSRQKCLQLKLGFGTKRWAKGWIRINFMDKEWSIDHVLAPNICHINSKSWVNRDWIIRFRAIFGDFWGREPRLYCDFQNLSVFSNFWKEKVHNTFFNTLEPFWKSDLHWTQLSTTYKTLSYEVVSMAWNSS